MSRLEPYSILHCHTDASLLDGLSKPEQVVKRCVDIGIKNVALTDHGNLTSAIEFHKKATKAGLKPILGCELYICGKPATERSPDNRKCDHLVVLAKNIEGWRQLLKLTSRSNHADVFYYKPRLSLNEIADFSNGSLIAFSGHAGSSLCNVLFENPNLIYDCRDTHDAGALLKGNWEEEATELAKRYVDIFGDGFFMEIQLIDSARLPSTVVVAECLRKVAKKLGIKCIGTPDAHYPSKEDAPDQRVLLSSAMKTTLKQIAVKIRNNEDVQLGGFFKSNNYHIPTTEEMGVYNTEEELDNTNLVASICETYKVTNQALFPSFPCPNGLSSPEYLLEQCRDGWRRLIANRVPKEAIPNYVARVKHENTVLTECGLSDYFLLVQDVVRHAHAENIATGVARGSAGGCLTSYLLGITRLDPIPYGLLFERFYSKGRQKNDDTINYPDIDLDVEVVRRHEVIAYMEQKWGQDKVANIATFGRLRGRSAIKEVLRAHDSCSFDEMNKITEWIPDEAKISDQLEEQRISGDEPSIIRWALENNSKELEQWCYLDDNGECQGPMAKLFEQAMRLEGTRKSQGKHASGIIVCSTSISDVAPLIYDKGEDKLMVGWDLKSAEDAGLVKVDILGTSVLDKLHLTADLVGGKRR